MRPYVRARHREIGREPRVGASSEQIEIEDGHDREDHLHEGFAARMVLWARPVHTAEQLARSDRGDRGFFVWTKTLREALADQACRIGSLLSSALALEIDEDRCVYDSSHRTSGIGPTLLSTASMSLTKSGSGAGAPARANAISRTGRPRRRVPGRGRSSG